MPSLHFDKYCKNGTLLVRLSDNLMIINKTSSHSTLTVTNRQKPDNDQQAVLYIVVVLLFYSIGIIIAIVMYLKRERDEMMEEKLYDNYFQFKADPDRLAREFRVQQFAIRLKAIEEEKRIREEAIAAMTLKVPSPEDFHSGHRVHSPLAKLHSPGSLIRAFTHHSSRKHNRRSSKTKEKEHQVKIEIPSKYKDQSHKHKLSDLGEVIIKMETEPKPGTSSDSLIKQPMRSHSEPNARNNERLLSLPINVYNSIKSVDAQRLSPNSSPGSGGSVPGRMGKSATTQEISSIPEAEETSTLCSKSQGDLTAETNDDEKTSFLDVKVHKKLARRGTIATDL